MIAAAEAHQQARDRVRRWESIVSILGERLMLHSENDHLAKLYDAACSHLHRAEMAEEELR